MATFPVDEAKTYDPVEFPPTVRVFDWATFSYVERKVKTSIRDTQNVYIQVPGDQEFRYTDKGTVVVDAPVTIYIRKVRNKWPL